jgi:anaerobic ribonucleoside-triphosphate reductase activating protein
MKISVNKAHFPVTVLGPGRRIGLWLQGCSIRCPDCISQDTWEVDAARAVEIDDLLLWCQEVSAGSCDGITISGGEPFDQPEALLELLNKLDCWRVEQKRQFDLLCYSGYPLAALTRRHADILALLDAVISEPFVEQLPMTHVLRGSSNQRLVPLSLLGEQRYASMVDRQSDPDAKRIQMAVQGQRVWYIGIPKRGDMARLEQLCALQGIEFDQASWRQ